MEFVCRCRSPRPNCMVWSGCHGFPMLQPRQRRLGFCRISSGVSQPRRPIETLLNHICKQEVQRADSNALFLQHLNCIASCHTERPYSTKASASAARMCRVAVVCDKQSTQGECLLTLYPLPPVSGSSSEWYSCCCTPSIDSWHIRTRADLQVDLVLWSYMLS